MLLLTVALTMTLGTSSAFLPALPLHPGQHAAQNGAFSVQGLTPTTSELFTSPTTALNAIPLALRGGASALAAATPAAVFNKSLLAIFTLAMFRKFVGVSSSKTSAEEASPAHRRLRFKFLPIFYVLRLADWLQGPYFYSVYATKILADGTQYPMSLISKLFLTGFASTALFGPSLGR